MHAESTQAGGMRSRLTFFIVCIVASFSLLLIYLFIMQVVRGGEFREISKSVTSREITIPTQRGEIYDRHFDIPLVMNVESFVLELVPGQVKYNKRTYFQKLARFLNMDIRDFDAKVPLKSYNLFNPIEIMSSVSFEKISHIAEFSDNFPGVTWSSTLKREYVVTGSLAHVIGYVGKIDEAEIELMYNLQYNRNSRNHTKRM